jgi:phosphoribosylglycinamide formyltransferase-1
LNIAVLCSGSGTNLQAIIDQVKRGYIPARIAVVVSDNREAYALERAKAAGIEAIFVDPDAYKSREDFDRAIVKELKKRDIDLVALAGFMRILSPYFIKEYRHKILNIHPALLPAFKGVHGIKDALTYGVNVTGPTVHFVEEELDSGAIILQSPIEIAREDTEESLLKRVHAEEHKIYPKAIKLFVEGKLKLEGRKVHIKDEDQDKTDSGKGDTGFEG